MGRESNFPSQLDSFPFALVSLESRVGAVLTILIIPLSSSLYLKSFRTLILDCNMNVPEYVCVCVCVCVSE